MNTLITGAMGFTGRTLHKHLNKLQSSTIHYSDLSCNDLYENCWDCNLLDEDNVKSLIQKISPDKIYHLSGSFANVFDTDLAANVQATRNILEAVKQLDKPCRVLLIGSAAEYGFIEKNDNPICEEQELKPASTYGLTKVFQTYLMKYYVDTFGMDIVMARPFNLFGKNMSNKLFVGRVYEQIYQLKNKEINKIKVGNLDNERDYISIEDAVKHYVSIMEKGIKGDIYNVGKGVPIKIDLILKQILEEENIDFGLVEIIDTPRNTIFDVPVIYAEISKLNNLG